jgi:uncharacterized protein
MHLLDVNSLLANSLEAHEHHVAVRDWLSRRSLEPIATCALTETSLVLLLMNPAVNENPVDASTALALVDLFHQHPLHRFLAVLPAANDPAVATTFGRISGYRQVTDGYLIALARANGGKLATFDKKLVAAFGGEGIEVIPTVEGRG